MCQLGLKEALINPTLIFLCLEIVRVIAESPGEHRNQAVSHFKLNLLSILMGCVLNI